jgi:hypothetical protein
LSTTGPELGRIAEDKLELSVDDELKDIFESLPIGKVVFNPPYEMRVGITEHVEARITKSVTEELTKGLKGKGEPLFEYIKVSPIMIVDLKGDNFNIKPLFSNNELVIKSDYTQWEWDVTPERNGMQKLILCIEAVIERNNRPDRRTNINVLEKEIAVKVNPGHAILGFFGKKL